MLFLCSFFLWHTCCFSITRYQIDFFGFIKLLGYRNSAGNLTSLNHTHISPRFLALLVDNPPSNYYEFERSKYCEEKVVYLISRSALIGLFFLFVLFLSRLYLKLYTLNRCVELLPFAKVLIN